MILLLSGDDLNEMATVLRNSVGTALVASFHLHDRVAPYRYGARSSSHQIHPMCGAMRRFSFQYGVNCANVLRKSPGDVLGPMRHYQQGLGWYYPGKSLDLVRGSNMYSLCIGGMMQYELLLPSATVPATVLSVSPGEIVRLTAEQNGSMDHRITLLRNTPGCRECFLVTFGLVRMLGAGPGVWTVPARRLAPRPSNGRATDEEKVADAAPTPRRSSICDL